MSEVRPAEQCDSDEAVIEYRMATADDAEAIFALIYELAVYEKAADQVVSSPEILRDWVFERGAAEVLVAVHPAAGIVGMALFFQNFSTWTGRGGLYLEDLIVNSEYRHLGIGTQLMRRLARICVERGWMRFDWVCLDWNESGLAFYRGLGAERVADFVPIRLEGEALHQLARS